MHHSGRNGSPGKGDRELTVLSDYYDFMLWMIQRIERFPRHHRYSLGITMENRMQAILAGLIEAKYTRAKAPLLHQVNLDLEVLRFQSRLATDVKALPLRSRQSAMRMLENVGSQVGGWRRAVSTPERDTTQP